MNNKDIVLISLENISAGPQLIPFYAADNFVIGPIPALGGQIKPQHRLNHFQIKAAHKHLSGDGLVQMTERFMSVLRQRIEKSQVEKDWAAMPDLYESRQFETSTAAIEALCG